jgi:alpha-mannosidase
MPRTYSVISHTHWDREWYQPFEEFRLRLVELMDRLLEILASQPTYRFHLDAQTIVLEDYLEIRPQRRKELSGYIREGRLLVGPWYVQNDFYLTSGEATIRNLLIGSELAREFGGCTMVGYAPDQFGLISQLPQILKRFGISACIFGRGYSFPEAPPSEFWWRTQDGSRVLAIHMPYWYNNAQRFPADPEKAERMLRHIAHRLERTATTDQFLLMNGVDHLEAQEDLLPILNALQARLPRGEHILQDTMPEYVERLREEVSDLHDHHGELRYGGLRGILAGTLSSRVYLKQWNVRCQSLLEQRLEPLYAIVKTLGIGDYPADHLRYLWKTLIANHAHDSICGCSVDRVHQQMMERFQWVWEAGNALLDRACTTIAAHMDRQGLDEQDFLLCVFNTHVHPRDAVVEATVEVPVSRGNVGFELFNSQGGRVEYDVLGVERRAKGLISPINLPGVMEVHAYRIRFFANGVPGFGFTGYRVRCGGAPQNVTKPTRRRKPLLENDHLRVRINDNGTIDLFHKGTERWFEELLVIEDEEDTGDSYVFFEHPNSLPRRSPQNGTVKSRVEADRLRQRAEIRYIMKLPERYDFDAGTRSDVLVDVPVVLELTLDAGSDVLNVDITVDNRARDHRMRVLIPTRLDAEQSTAGSPFDAVVRSRRPSNRTSEPVRQKPAAGYVDVADGAVGIAVLSEGLYEFEHLEDIGNTIAVTLLRGNDYIVRQPGGGLTEERWRVPENQCLGTHRFRLALYPHSGGLVDAQVPTRGQSFLNPLFTAFDAVDLRTFAGGRPFVQDAAVGEIFYRDPPHAHATVERYDSFGETEDTQMVYSCLKQAEDRPSIVMRVYNPAEFDALFNLSFRRSPKLAYRIGLDESRTESLTIAGNRVVRIAALPKEIVTVEVVFPGETE